MGLNGAERIAKERLRQIERKCWGPQHDDDHTLSELAWAAACYAAPKKIYALSRKWGELRFFDPWPVDWEDKRSCTSSRIRQLEKAGALIAAEIDRLLRNPDTVDGCAAGQDGDCRWDLCPQVRDNEPQTSGRVCPLWEDE